MANTNKIEELKRLLEESNEKIKHNKLLMAQLKEDFARKEEEKRLAQEKLDKLTPVKILTRKEREKLKKIEAENLRKKIVQERLTIDHETKEALKHAEKIRKDSKGEPEFEQKLANVSALKTEAHALGKATKILNEMLHEKENSARDILAQNAIEESIIAGYKKEINKLHLSKSSKKEVLDKLKEKMDVLRKNKSNTHNSYLKLKKEIENISSKLYGYERQLAACLNEFKSYGDTQISL